MPLPTYETEMKPMRTQNCLLTSFLLVAWLFAGIQIACCEEVTVNVGDRVRELKFKDIRFLERSLADFKDKKLFVVVCTNTTCPLVKKYLPKLKRLELEYRARGVQFLALNVSPGDSIRDMAAFGVEFAVPFPCVKDVGATSVSALGLQRTPEVAVIDSQRRLRYRGRIDDQYRIGGTLPKPSQNNLKEALDALLSQQEILVKQTSVDGCVITHSAQHKPNRSITYHEHIKPLMDKHCVECHREQTEAPFGLTSFEEVHANAAMIAEVVKDQRMPPSYAATKYSDFVNHRAMPHQDRQLIAQWVQLGMPLGNSANSKESERIETEQSVQNKWEIGKPDLVINMLGTHTLQADGYIPYKYILLPYVFLEDTWIEAIQILPSNPRVLHHCNMGAVTAGGDPKRFRFITGKVPGGDSMKLDDGLAVLIPKGSALGLQIHYTTTGKEEKCKISVGFRFARGTVHKQLRHLMIVNRQFAIPPGESHHEVRASKTLNRNAVGVGLFTHMHLRGKDMTFLAHHPNGTTETLLLVPNYSFDWQLSYRWHPGKKQFPKGTRFECVAHYDNSTFNPFNPDATVTVKDGPQTYHEMMYGFVFYKDENEDLNLMIDPKTGYVVK